MDYYNTIILHKGESTLTNKEFAKFSEGDSIFGIDAVPIEIKRWNGEDAEIAKKELSKYRCEYRHSNEYLWDIEEYALEYCDCDENGEFIEGSDFDLAEKEEYGKGEEDMNTFKIESDINGIIEYEKDHHPSLPDYWPGDSFVDSLSDALGYNPYTQLSFIKSEKEYNEVLEEVESIIHDWAESYEEF